MNILTDNDIEFIYADLKSKGLTLEGLVDEMVDHLCCIIEPEMASGVPFMLAYNNIVNKLDHNIFPNIQHQTILSTNLKFQNMKKSMIGFGVLGTAFILIGTLLKNLHLPFAGIGVTFGVLFTVFGFLPLFFYIMYKEQQESKGIILAITGYLTAALLLLGILFRIQHWPGTHYLLLAGQIMLVVAFLPVYLTGVFRKAGKTNIHIGYVIIVVAIGIASLYMFFATTMSREVIDKLYAINKNNIEVSHFFDKQNDSLLLKLMNAPQNKKNKAEEIKKESEQFGRLIADIQNKLLKSTNQPSATLTDFEKKDNERIPRKVMKQYKMELLNAYKNYSDFMIKSAENDIQKYRVADYLKVSSLSMDISTERFNNMPLIGTITYLTGIQKNVVMAENVILTSL